MEVLLLTALDTIASPCPGSCRSPFRAEKIMMKRLEFGYFYSHLSNAKICHEELANILLIFSLRCLSSLGK